MRILPRVVPAALAGMLVVFAPLLTPGAAPAPTATAAPAPGSSQGQLPFPFAMQPDGVRAASAALAEANTGLLLWSRQPTARVPIASITKVMTAVVVLESGDLDRPVTVTRAALDYAASEGGSTANLNSGEVLTGRQLLYAMMLPSGCEAAYALAEAYGPGQQGFLAKMNDTARRLGMADTHFADPSGLPIPDDYATWSTAADLVRLARHAMSIPLFRQIVAIPVHHEPAGPTHKAFTWENTNDLLGRYPGIAGIKTGNTDAAGTCLLFEASRGGQRLIGVVLNSSPWDMDAATADAERLMNWGFVPILSGLPIG
ncbi:MAG TPA: serine hydrolase [Nocardia sp.]|uniref:D-alanyl-D-alanine carboxypeptidase family protein n=1 Tax=Nocardia sp. TaxID=1821 RepID=UPI002B4B8CCE|nr:serine hydrolase [Nocardia sp.]HLS75736.1 serine hydrolase [Nocardia sp.]